MKSTLHFNDGQRKIDFVMAYIEDEEEEEEGGSVNYQRRQVYQEALKKKGLELEIEPKEVCLCMIKIHD